MTSTPAVMLGMELPDVAAWSERVTVALGQNPSVFTGPGTNTYLVGTGSHRILLDPGQGVTSYLPILERALAECGAEGLQEIVLTHGHPDHIGGVAQILERFGPLSVKKFPWPENDAEFDFPITSLADGDVVQTEGATLRGVLTPGHAPDHLCFVLEEEGALFSGDNVLGVGTTVIPSRSGDLGAYMDSLECMLALGPTHIYPAHGPLIEDGPAKLREYLDHRRQRDEQILAALADGPLQVAGIVKVVYAAYPESLHAAAGQSVASHLRKLEREARVVRSGEPDLLVAAWSLP
ncbi:MAG: beta-lactamase-like protein 2 [Proteobacteria bacterium]|nr:beta-lactamase-like protein 2 [Pseudomonadota bacterium]